MASIDWVLVNCNTVKEAEKIGSAILRLRLAACFDVIPRLTTRYYWPPKTGRLESGKGAILILETFQRNYKKIATQGKNLHTDKVPFIGQIKSNRINQA